MTCVRPAGLKTFGLKPMGANIMRNRITGLTTGLIGALALITAAVSGAAAQDAVKDRLSGLKLSGDQPIQIESDKLEVDEGNRKATFSGNVSVVQGPTLMKAGRMTVFYADQGGNAAATAPGANPNIDRLEVDGTVLLKSGKQTATGDRGTFDMKSEVLTLSGKRVALSEGPNVLTGCKLTVQMRTGQAKFEACGGRIKTLLTPGSQGN